MIDIFWSELLLKISRKQLKYLSVVLATMLAHFDQCSFSAGLESKLKQHETFHRCNAYSATSLCCYSPGSTESLSHLDFWL